jgi:hypothetical protein
MNMYKESVSRNIYDADPVLNLRIAIVNQACLDWRNGSEQDRHYLERWFLSDWGQYLSGDKGEVIIENLKKGL